MPGDSDEIKQKKKEGCGVRCGLADLPDSNFAGNIRLENTISISIAPSQNFQLNWMDSVMGRRCKFCMTRNGRHFSLPGELRNCVFGTIDGGKIPMVFCWKYGMPCIVGPGASR